MMSFGKTHVFNKSDILCTFIKMTAIQDALYDALNESKDNKIPSSAVKINPYVFNTLQLIDKNRKAKLSNDEKVSQILDICNKYKTTGNRRKKQPKQPTTKDIDATLCKHNIVTEEIQERIAHSIEIAAEELKIKVNMPQEMNNDDYEEEEEISNEIPKNDNNKKFRMIIEEEEEEEEDAIPVPIRTPPKPYDDKQNKEDELKSDYSLEEEEDSDDLFVEESTPVIVRRN